VNRDQLYLTHILTRINRILKYTASGKADFLTSEISQDAVLRNFEIIGEATKRLSDEVRQKDPAIPWRRIAGFRDVLIHDYDDVDLDEVWEIVEQNLFPLKHAVEAALQELTGGEEDNFTD
jgi:uncharacterized protein with HEPN domain